MDVFKRFRKCFLCGQKRLGLRKAPRYGIYDEVYECFAYHPVCLKLVLCEPEKYSHEEVNTALQIVYLVKAKEEKEKRIKTEMEKERRECIKKAKKFCKAF